MTDFINANIIYLVPIGVVTLLLILVLIGVTLAKTAGYFVERFLKRSSISQSTFHTRPRLSSSKPRLKLMKRLLKD